MYTGLAHVAAEVLAIASAGLFVCAAGRPATSRRLDRLMDRRGPADARAPRRRSWFARQRRAAAGTSAYRSSELPLFVDLVAAGLAAGGTVHDSLLAVTHALPGGIADRLRPVGAALSLGAEPAVAWAPLRTDGTLGPLAVTLTRSATSGAPAADSLVALAVDLRTRRRLAATGAARSAGVRAVAPLGLCFLPAFVLVGVVPTIVGLAGAALSGR